MTTLDDGANVLAVYDYLGLGRVVGTEYWMTDLESDVHGASSGSYPGLDDFNRIVTNKWTRDLATDVNFYEIDITYDENSNITLIEDNVHSGFDVDYSIDDVNRLTRAEEGTWGGSSITTTSRDQQWTLDHVGNWDVGKLDLDGDGNFNGTDEWNDDRTHNDVNELTARDTDDNGSDDFTLTYDEVGNLTDDGEDFKYVWDAFGRLRKILDRDDDSLVAEYRYNGLNFRISEHADTDDDGDVDGDDKWFHSAFNERWQLLAVFREDDTAPKEEYVHHLAGLDGRGGSSYIDLLVMRFKDADTAWTSASDGTLEEQIYYCQNWRADVSALVEDTGSAVELKEWVKYFAYGTPFGLPGGDTDSDGDCDATDVSQVQTWINAPAYDVRGDIDLDGNLDGSDKSTIQSEFVGVSQGYDSPEASLVANSMWFAGGSQVGRALIKSRLRPLSPHLGRWIARDPLQYEDGLSLQWALRSNPIRHLDPLGALTLEPGGASSPGGLPLNIECGESKVYSPAISFVCDYPPGQVGTWEMTNGQVNDKDVFNFSTDTLCLINQSGTCTGGEMFTVNMTCTLSCPCPNCILTGNHGHDDEEGCSEVFVRASVHFTGPDGGDPDGYEGAGSFAEDWVATGVLCGLAYFYGSFIPVPGTGPASACGAALYLNHASPGGNTREVCCTGECPDDDGRNGDTGKVDAPSQY